MQASHCCIPCTVLDPINLLHDGVGSIAGTDAVEPFVCLLSVVFPAGPYSGMINQAFPLCTRSCTRPVDSVLSLLLVACAGLILHHWCQPRDQAETCQKRSISHRHANCRWDQRCLLPALGLTQAAAVAPSYQTGISAAAV